ncbi:DUF2950 domain-containing protein [Ralstonia sp. ASV6]|uniref:DUF2950 domain-containing protein n=1 Tax=Ralstonia sp. ASV6 TaxID=2795124 RepID=UPI0018EB76E9|nr:DUF2950 domain-containing protein [Ralstonia sp. ASV6]
MRETCKVACLRRLAILLVALAAWMTCPSSWADRQLQQGFASPEKAAEALAAAWRSGNSDALLALFGPGGAKLVRSGDPIGEQIARSKLASAYDEAHRIETDGAGYAVIILGKDDWPYPIPLAMRGAQWQFDTQAGAQQIIDRRIGHHEAHAIRVCRAYVEAQLRYATSHRTVDGQPEFAQRIASSPGKHDGLYWVASAGEEESPMGPLIAIADAQRHSISAAVVVTPFHGYVFRILTQQGAHAPGGAHDYVVNGHMTRGFALLAFPAAFGASGVMTFVVNQNGVVYEKNLGPHTADIARRMRVYDPDDSWKPALP